MQRLAEIASNLSCNTVTWLLQLQTDACVLLVQPSCNINGLLILPSQGFWWKLLYDALAAVELKNQITHQAIRLSAAAILRSQHQQ